MGDAAKQLIPFLQRADEMQKHDRRVAYYCARPRCAASRARRARQPDGRTAGRMYALEAGLALPERSADTTALLSALMKQLEARGRSARLVASPAPPRRAPREQRARAWRAA
jgi:hypothetical protein